MNNRLSFLFLILSLAMWLTLPGVPIAAQSRSYQEGAFLIAASGHTIGRVEASIKATKTITYGAGRTSHVSALEIAIHCNHGDAVLSVGPVTVQVPGDPDNLEVSRDLGWAGLDTAVSVFDQVSQSNVTIEIHAYWWANTGVTESSGLFSRQARLEGTIVTPRCTFDLSRPNGPANGRSGHTFSTRNPGT
jgi:hypothetical protein